MRFKVPILPKIFASPPREIHKHALVYNLQSNSRNDYFSRPLFNVSWNDYKLHKFLYEVSCTFNPSTNSGLTAQYFIVK